MAVFVFLTSEIPILEQKYKFHLTHCRNKVVRYEITSSCIFESSLYDNFPRRYGRNQTPSYSSLFLTSESPILEQKYQFHLTHCRNKVVRYEITSPCIFESSLYDDFPRRYGRYECTRFHAFSRNCCFGVEISILDDAL